MAENQPQPDGTDPPAGPWQAWLEHFCAENHLRSPVVSIASDRRGGRTAWSAAVQVGDTTYAARYWYDGTFIGNAKEDASQCALQQLSTAQQFQRYQELYNQHIRQQHAHQQQQYQGDSGTQSPNSNSMWQGYGR